MNVYVTFPESYRWMIIMSISAQIIALTCLNLQSPLRLLTQFNGDYGMDK